MRDFYLGWLIVGLVIAWAIKTVIPGPQRSGLVTFLVVGVVGAFVGGYLAITLGRAPRLGASVMAATLGAIIFSGVLRAMDLSKKSA